MKNFIIKILEILTFVFFIAVVAGFAIFFVNMDILNGIGINFILGLIVGFIVATLSSGLIFLAIQNNEVLKEIRDSLKK